MIFADAAAIIIKFKLVITKLAYWQVAFYYFLLFGSLPLAD
jgi:hypothetical protein